MRIAIVGGSGKMGRWFADFLLKDGRQVIIIGRSETKLLEVRQQLGVETATSVEAVAGADVVLISVPIDNFEGVVKQLQPYLQPEQVVIDITSVKVHPVEVMHKHIKAGLVLGAHPVFGPGASGIRNQNFVLTPTNDKETAFAEKTRRYLEARGARVTLMTPREHDEMMVVILGLAHFITIVSAETLSSFDNLKQMHQISGTTYRFLLTLVESVISEDPELYASLQMNLPKIVEVEELFQRNLETWAAIVRNKDRQEFVSRMGALKDRLEQSDPDFRKAYQNMYSFLEGSG
ncbi:prephenate dehydrogenase [Chloroflexota bacterium]